MRRGIFLRAAVLSSQLSPLRSTFTLRQCTTPSPSCGQEMLCGNFSSCMRAKTIGMKSAFRDFSPAFRFGQQCRAYRSTPLVRYNRRNDQLAGFTGIQTRKPDEEKQDDEEEAFDGGGPGEGYLPFPPPFHTINIMGFLLLVNCLIYGIMNFCSSDDWRDFIVEHFTLSIHNVHRIYPIVTQSFYQEHILQLAIDCWLLWQFGNVMLGFLGGKRLAFFWFLCTLGGSGFHLGRQWIELNYLEYDPLDVRGRCFGPNPFILGLVSVEGLIFRRLNFIQSPPIPFLVLTAFVMVIDVWRIFTTKPEEHGASTGGALVAYVFWMLPTRMLGLDKLTAAI